MLEEVPEEIRVTPERDERLLTQSRALAGTDVVRLLDLVSAALEATANGAQARIQLELVLIKASAPEVDPSTAALLARIERLEAAVAGARPGPPVLQNGATAPATAPAAAVSPRPPEPEPVDPAPESAAPPAPATAAPPAPAGPPELQTVAACWPAVIDVVRQENEMLAALLADARPVALHNQDVIVAFPAGKAFLKRKAEQDDYRRATAEALRSVLGTPLVLRYELLEDDLPEPSDAGGVSHEELVKRLVEEFDAQEVLDDDQEGAT
jgi:DNA polymerase III subunit gamma/tau